MRRSRLINKTRWRWFVGELIVVIVGVLVALSIEQAWSDRKDRDLELEYLRTIQAAVIADIETVEGFLSARLEMTIGPVVPRTRFAY